MSQQILKQYVYDLIKANKGISYCDIVQIVNMKQELTYGKFDLTKFVFNIMTSLVREQAIINYEYGWMINTWEICNE